MNGEVTKPQGQPRACRAGSQCQGDTLGTGIRASCCPSEPSQGPILPTSPCHCRAETGPGTSLSRTQIPRGERQGRAPPTSQPQKSFYFLRKCGTKGTKADIPAVPTGWDKTLVSTTLFGIRGDASTQNIGSPLELKPFVSPSLIAGTFPTQLHSSCC